tara:strand:+ start:7318 stop:7566 length:249 start_codon:yes stop_codon:yes gene_type:complete
MPHKPKNWKFPNAKNKLDKNLRNEELKKYGSTLGEDHPFNSLKEKEKFKDMEKHFIKSSKTQKPDPNQPKKSAGGKKRRKSS